MEGFYILTNAYLIQFTDDRPTLQENDAIDVFFGMFHLIYRALLNGFSKFLIAPVGTHFGLNHVLADRG